MWLDLLIFKESNNTVSNQGINMDNAIYFREWMSEDKEERTVIYFSNSKHLIANISKKDLLEKVVKF